MAASKKAWTVEMDGALISLVKDYPFLWNLKVENFQKLYRTQYHVMYKIVDEMKRLFPENNTMFTSERVKARLKVLKQKFVQEMHRQARSEELCVPRSRRFVHYDELSFLKQLYEKKCEAESTSKFGRSFIAEISSGVVNSKTFDSNSESQIANRNSTSLESLCPPVKDAKFGISFNAETKIVETSSGVANSSYFNSNSKSQIANRNSSSLESECSPVKDASSSDFSEKEDNHGGERKMNPILRVIDAVFSARTSDDGKLNELFESFGNYVSETLKSLSPESRKRIIFQFYNVLRNRND